MYFMIFLILEGINSIEVVIRMDYFERVVKKRSTSVIAILVILNIVFISTTIWYKYKLNNPQVKFYTVEGESKDIKITNGLIIIYPKYQIFLAGDLQYLSETKNNVQNYSLNIYLDKPDMSKPILSTSLSYEGVTKGTVFPDEFILNKNLGEIRSKDLFTKEDIKDFKNNMYFSLKGSTMDKKDFEYKIKLDVKEINVKENK